MSAEASAAAQRGLFQRFEGMYLLDGLRTPMVDYQSAFADANPTVLLWRSFVDKHTEEN